jgi:hypothetical protein
MVYFTENSVPVSCAKGYDCCIRYDVRTSRKILYLSVMLRDMIAVYDLTFIPHGKHFIC